MRFEYVPSPIFMLQRVRHVAPHLDVLAAKEANPSSKWCCCILEHTPRGVRSESPGYVAGTSIHLLSDGASHRIASHLAPPEWRRRRETAQKGARDAVCLYLPTNKQNLCCCVLLFPVYHPAWKPVKLKAHACPAQLVLSPSGGSENKKDTIDSRPLPPHKKIV